MYKNIEEYVKVYENHISQDVCKQVIQDMTEGHWEKHKYHNPATNESQSYDNDLSIAYCKTEAGEEIKKQIWFALREYFVDHLKDMNWVDGWNGYSEPRYNKYEVGTEMRLHCDHIHTLFDGERRGIPVLTVLGGLNDDYEGGEFVMFKDKQVSLPAGSVAIFPSNFLFPHLIKPVTSGIRYSYVSWTW